jgi:probable F420-dependent oxidoreductase
MGRVGLWSTVTDAVPVPAAQELLAEVEQLGYGAYWFGEAYGREALTNAAALLAGTSSIAVATGIASIHGRDAVAARGAQRTLASLHPGRFVLGLGVSHRPLVERVRHGAYERPLTQMRTYLDLMAEAPFLAADGDAATDTVLGALGPRMTELARDRTDGAHPYKVTPEHTRWAAGVLGPERHLAVEQAVVLTNDDELGRRRAAAHLELYSGLPNYRNAWGRLGFGEEHWVRGGSPELQEALVTWGDEAVCATAVRAHLDAGATHVCVQVLGDHPADVGAITDGWRRLAPALLA